jgi:hypothetical protein
MSMLSKFGNASNHNNYVYYDVLVNGNMCCDPKHVKKPYVYIDIHFFVNVILNRLFHVHR